MTDLEKRIEQFRKMANDDPDNELGHYRLGQLLMEAGQFPEAVKSFRRTLELSPQFSKVFQLLAESQVKLNQKTDAIATLKQGYAVADERGDHMPRDAMAKMLADLGEAAPVPQKAAPAGGGGTGGFRCQRPGCMWGQRARQLPAPPTKDDRGRRIHEQICADCWNEWLRNYSVKVINELRIDLSSERGFAEYTRYMNEFLGFDEVTA